MTGGIFAVLGLLALGGAVLAFVEAQRLTAALLAVRRETTTLRAGRWTVLRGVVRCASASPPRAIGGPAVFVRRVARATSLSEAPLEGSEAISSAPPGAETSRHEVCDEVLFCPARLELHRESAQGSGYRTAQPDFPDSIALRLEPLLLLDTAAESTLSKHELKRELPELYERAARVSEGENRVLHVTIDELSVLDGARIIVGGMLQQNADGTWRLESSEERPAIILPDRRRSPQFERALRCLAITVFGLMLAVGMWVTPALWLKP